MTTEKLLDEALGSSDPVRELRSVVMRLSTQGHTKDQILERLERSRQELRRAGREKEEDAVMDVMDFLHGWCSPHMKLRADSSVAPAVDSVNPDGKGRA